MSTKTIITEQLRRLIGSPVQYQGMAYQVIEVLNDGPAVVIQSMSSDSVIQANQHGDANRRVPNKTVTIQVYCGDCLGLHPAFLELGLDLEK